MKSTPGSSWGQRSHEHGQRHRTGGLGRRSPKGRPALSPRVSTVAGRWSGRAMSGAHRGGSAGRGSPGSRDAGAHARVNPEVFAPIRDGLAKTTQLRTRPG